MINSCKGFKYSSHDLSTDSVFWSSYEYKTGKQMVTPITCVMTILSGHVTFTWRDLKVQADSVYIMILERVRTGLVFVLRLNTILGFQYRAST